MKYLYPLLILIFCACTDIKKVEPLAIKPLYPYVHDKLLTDSGEHLSYRVRLNQVENFQSYNHDSLALDNFVRKNIDPDYKDYSTYSIQFFKKLPVQNQELKKGKPVKEFDFKDPRVAYI